LAGLRIGLAVAAPEMIEALWRRHEYRSDCRRRAEHDAGEIALQPAKRATLLDRQKGLSATATSDSRHIRAVRHVNSVECVPRLTVVSGRYTASGAWFSAP